MPPNNANNDTSSRGNIEIEGEQVDETDDLVIVEEEGKHDESDTYNGALHKEILQVMTQIADWEIGDFVSVVYDSQWYPGQITFVNQEEDTVTVKCMEYVNVSSRTNRFSWPKRIDEKPYLMEELILKLDPPKELKGSKRQKHFCLSESDYAGACDVFRMLLDTQ